MTLADNPHFRPVANWEEAARILGYTPKVPARTAGAELQSLRIYVRDHKLRDVPAEQQSLEARYGEFVFTQVRCSEKEALRQTVEVVYGSDAEKALINGCEARVYELGPEPAPGDIDPRSPAVVVWCEGEMFYLLASDSMKLSELIRIALI